MGAFGSDVGFLPRFFIAAALWVLWLLPFFRKAMGPRETAVAKNRSARWGMILQGIAYAIIFASRALVVDAWRVPVGIILGVAGIAISFRAVRHLDKQWHFDAVLSSEHKLVRTGPYAIVRHPIYASMLAMLLAYGFLLSRWAPFAVSILVFLVGIEIRVQVEDRLLRSRFGPEFEDYARQVSAYMPFVR